MSNQPNDILLGVDGDMQKLDPGGREFTQGYEDGLFREERAASSTLRTDWLKQKKNWTLDYSEAKTVTVDRFEYLYNLYTTLTLQVYESGVLKTYYAKMAPFSKTRFRLNNNGLWTGVSVLLREV